MSAGNVPIGFTADSVLLEMTAEETFETFCKQWTERNPLFQLDDPKVREEMMTLVSVVMSLLAISGPEVWQEFMTQTATLAKQIVPKDIQQTIKTVKEATS
jgi:hypothetical protein